MIEEIYAIEDDDGVEIISWPTPEYQRVCAQGHLVTNLFNSYEVSRGKGEVSYACKICQLEANQRQKEKKQGTVAGESFEEIPDTPEHRAKIEDEHEPGPDERPGEERVNVGGMSAPASSEILTRLERIEQKMDDFIADRHPHIATRILTDRIKQLEEQLAEATKGPGLDEMTFDQLKAKAAELGVEIPKGLRSAGARKLIQEHLAGQPSIEDVEDAALAAAGDPDEVEEAVHDEAVSTEPEQDDIVDAEIVEDEPEEDDEPEPEPAPRRRPAPGRRRRSAPATEEELEAAAQAATERQAAKRAAAKAQEDDDEEPAPRRRRRPRADAEG